ncbi:MAG: hypothetical protein K1060chlam2_00283 [Chlamydiae bacterium]|nr:hypothetical protein [Chlamydiota bacterium]
MKNINHKILSLPPYVSTSWKNINTLHVKELDGKSVLVIVLHNGTIIDIPNLDSELIEQVFAAHTNYVEQDQSEPQVESLKKYEPPKGMDENSFSFGIPFQMSGAEGLDNVGSFLQHNPEQSDAPQMPPEVIQKITSITKALGMDMDQMTIPKAEPHCNCPYCQIARAIQEGDGEITDQKEAEEEITEDDLRFRDWDIKQEGDKLYIVTNPLNAEEHYQVFLGSPVGCTCGEENCEHVRTVLNS